jgi:hypothetical protein
MKKAVLIIAALLAALSLPATAFAAVPDVGVKPGRTSAGVSLYNLDLTNDADGNWGDGFKFYEGYAAVGVAKDTAIFAAYGTMGKTLPAPADGEPTRVETSYTDYGLQYAISPHVGLLAGYRNLNGRQTTAADMATDQIRGFVYGAALRYDFGDRYAAYATYLRNDRVEDFVIGTAIGLNKNMFLDMSYKHLRGTTGSTAVMSGFGAAGVGIRF